MCAGVSPKWWAVALFACAVWVGCGDDGVNGSTDAVNAEDAFSDNSTEDSGADAEASEPGPTDADTRDGAIEDAAEDVAEDVAEDDADASDPDGEESEAGEDIPADDGGDPADVNADPGDRDGDGEADDVAVDDIDARDAAVDLPPVHVPNHCGDDAILGDGEIDSVLVAANPANVLSYFVQWETTALVPTELHLDCGADYQPTFLSEGAFTQHEVFVMGLWEGAGCEVSLCSRSGGDPPVQVTRSLAVGEIPDNMPDLTPATRRPGEMEAGWTVLNLSNQSQRVVPRIVLIDNQGRYRWYHVRDTRRAATAIESEVISDGILMSGSVNTPRPQIVNWRGQVVWTGYFPMHHEIRTQEGSEQRLMYVGTAPTTSCDQGVSGDTIVLRERGADVLWDWSFCEHYEPDPVFDDWGHINATVMMDETHILFSSRNQNALFRVAMASGEIDWMLGYGGPTSEGFHSDFAMAEDDRFEHQHAPEMQDDGNILLFDNGGSDRPWSRALEIAYDEDAMTAHAVWSFRPSPDIYAPTWGDADRLANGNTLVSFGVRDPAEASHLIEVTGDHEVVWDLVFEIPWSLYRADRVPVVSGQILSE